MYTAQKAFDDHQKLFHQWNNENRKPITNSIAKRMRKTTSIVGGVHAFWKMKQRDLARLCSTLMEGTAKWRGKNYIYRNEDFIGWTGGHLRHKEEKFE